MKEEPMILQFPLTSKVPLIKHIGQQTPPFTKDFPNTRHQLPSSAAAVPGYGKMSRPLFSSGEGIRVGDLNDEKTLHGHGVVSMF